MNLIAEVARLKELAVRAKKVERIDVEKNIRSVDSEYAVKSYLASFAMIDALGEIRAGDVGRIERIQSMLRGWIADHPLAQFEAELEMLDRYRDIAKKMEANHEPL